MTDSEREERTPGLESQLKNFEVAWEKDQEPEINDFLELAFEADRRQLLVELIKIDLERRWSDSFQHTAGSALPKQPLLEDYVQVYEQIGPIQELPIELVADEYRVRRRPTDLPIRINSLLVGAERDNDRLLRS